MPTWLPSVLTAAAMSICGQAVAYIIIVKVLGVRVDDHDRRIGLVEVGKLDATLHYAHKDDLIHRIATVTADAKSLGHRVNGVDLRITAVDDRIDRIKGVA